MSHDDYIYHRQREQQCRELAELAADPDVSRRHRELAELHASQAALFTGSAETRAGLGAA
jgi:hypothetical protein